MMYNTFVEVVLGKWGKTCCSGDKASWRRYLILTFFFEKKVLSVGVLDDFPHIDSHEASAPEILGRTKDSWLSCLRAVCGIEA
jgi:hypothetical protein